MFTQNSSLAALILVASAWAQAPQPSASVKVNFPNDAPLALVSGDWGESRTEARGGALLLDLHTSLSLRNVSQARIRGVALLVQAQEVTPGGKASVTVPSLDIGPGDTFPVRIDLRLLRPVFASGALAEITLDGVLFEDLSFYGPNRLNSRRAMTVWELEAQRDRRYFKSILEAHGPEALRQEALATLARLSEGDRAAIIAHCIRQEPIDQIAARLGLSEAAARKRVQRAIERLGALLKPQTAAPAVARFDAGSAMVFS